MRDKLIAIIKDSLFKHIDKSCNLAENIADDLLENGVVALLCKVGDIIYIISSGHIKEHKIEKIEITRSKICLFFNWHGMGYEIADSDLIGKTVFLSREEAERALRKEGEGK